VTTEQLENLEVLTWVSDDDGALVVQIDTSANAGRVRVNINDGAIWDGDPETHIHDFCDCVLRE
jgi:hypothetical protein